MRYANRAIVKVTLRADAGEWPVLVDASVVADVRDRRLVYEGRLWPIDIQFRLSSGEAGDLIFHDGSVEPIRLVGVYPDSEGQLAARFIGERHWKARPGADGAGDAD